MREVQLLFYDPQFCRVFPQWDTPGYPTVGDSVGEYRVVGVHRRGLFILGREVLHVWVEPTGVGRD